MKLRYYLRGLGIGMLVTALLMGVATNDLRAMTDEEIIQRASELGMVSGNKTLVIKDTPQPAATKEPLITTPEPTTEPEPTEEETPEPTKEPDSTKEPEPAQTPEPTVKPLGPQDLEPKVLVIKGGESSVSVSKNLQELGLVESASEYDSYLCKNGYDKVISVGTYEIPIDASYEDIARIITRR